MRVPITESRAYALILALMLNGFSPSLSKTISQTFGKLLKNDFASMLSAFLYCFIVTLRNSFIGFSYSSARVEIANVLRISSISFWCLSRGAFQIGRASCRERVCQYV